MSHAIRSPREEGHQYRTTERTDAQLKCCTQRSLNQMFFLHTPKAMILLYSEMCRNFVDARYVNYIVLCPDWFTIRERSRIPHTRNALLGNFIVHSKCSTQPRTITRMI